MSIKSFLSKKFGFRWSLYITTTGKELQYAMHEDSVVRILGYLTGYFKNGKKPVEPWSLYLNFNKTHESFELLPSHFEGDNLSKSLLNKINSIDPNFRVPGKRPIFVNAKTKKQLKIRTEIDLSNMKELIENYDKREEEITFFRVMDKVFDRR